MIRIALVILGLLLCSWKFTTGFLAGQDIRQSGEIILFELAPVDPRELFLGDYMTLRYDLGVGNPRIPGLDPDNEPLDVPDAVRGVAIIALDDNGVGRIVRFDDGGALAANERRIRYTRRSDWRPISIGGERYYFQSGTGERYEAARYGQFSVMPDGRALLVGLADAQRHPIVQAGLPPFDGAIQPAG